jgi:hypothetical protein
VVVGENSALPADLSRQLADTFRAFAGQPALISGLLQAAKAASFRAAFFFPFGASFPSEMAVFRGLGPQTPYAAASPCE